MFQLDRQLEKNPKSRRNGCGCGRIEDRASQIFVWDLL
jgi:hypothetical protein